MKFLNRFIGSNVLLKVTSINSVGVIIQMISGFAISKVMALYIGPQGFKLVGDLRNLLGAVQQVGILGTYNGVVKYVSEFKDNHPQLKRVLSTAFLISLIATVITAVLLFSFAESINSWIFESRDYSILIKAVALALPLYSGNFFCLAIINGFSKYKSYVNINIIANILGLLVTVTLIWQQQLTGAMVSLVLVPALNFIVTLFMFYRLKDISIAISKSDVDRGYAKKLGSFAVMKIISAISLPIVMIAIRGEIVEVESDTQAGYWEAINRISRYYMMFFTTLMSLYILPKLASTDSRKAFRKEIFNFYKTVLPLFAIGMLAIFLLKIYVIRIVLTKEFLPMESLFLWQLLGDFVKIMSVVIAYQFLAKNMFWHYIITEGISIAIIYFSSIYLINEFGFVGASMGHLFSYVIYLVVVVAVFWRSLFGKVS